MKVQIKVILEATHIDVCGQVVEVDDAIDFVAFDEEMKFDQRDKLTIRVKQIPVSQVLPPSASSF